MPQHKVFELTDYMYPIRVFQISPYEFTVEYGEEVRTGLTLGVAADTLGRSIMHLMSCEGRIENDT